MDEKLLITKRPEGSHLAGVWEFPGGKQENDEDMETCLQREIKEELGVEIRINKLISIVHHEYESKKIILHFFDCTPLQHEPQPLEKQEIRWVHPKELENYTFPPPDKEIVQALIQNTLKPIASN